MLQTVSIVLPTHNGSRYLNEAIDSCLKQSHSDLELIVVDDASVDHTPDLLRRYSDRRLKVIRHKTNLGLSAALNTGFAASMGEFLTWTSDDNRYHPTAVEMMLRALNENPDVGLVYAGMRLIDAQGAVLRDVPAEPPALLRQRSVVGACFLHRRVVYESIGDYDEGLPGVEDYDYWLRISALFPILALPEVLYDYRVHPASLTGRQTLVEAAKAYDRVQTKHFGSDPARFRRYLADLHISRAFEDYFSGNYASVASNVLRAVVLNRAFLKNRGVYAILFRSLQRRLSLASPSP